MRKLSIAFAVAVVASVLLLTPGIALANFGIHGGYSMDTDACAGCHRAHTAASPITWNNGVEERSALLISAADDVYEFCLTCHGSAAAGAATNVVDGVYESDEFGTQGARLNSGLFDLNNEHGVGDSKHSVTGSWGAWGGGATGRDGVFSTGYGELIPMSCTSCHDVHGSSNYRLLKDVVNGVRVGGYDELVPGVFTPTPFVISNETGFPAGGFRLHEDGVIDMEAYVPNYTTPQYAKAPGGNADKGISNWCAACHTQYVVESGTTNVGVYDTDGYKVRTISPDGNYDANDGFGFVTRHRHPVNVPMSNYLGPRDLIANPGVPLATDGGIVGTDSWVDCLTCHVSHGSDVTMEGFARVDDSTNPEPDTGPGGPGDPDRIGGVAPTWSNALLRIENRGVCQECHNK